MPNPFNGSIAIVGKVTSTSSAQFFATAGSTAGGNGEVFGLDSDGTGSWSFDFSSDANGNLSLLVNGVPHSLNPSASTMVTPSPSQFTIGGNSSAGGQVTGNIYEELVYSPAISNFSAYSYQHAQTGL